jgi:hypothetical protein
VIKIALRKVSAAAKKTLRRPPEKRDLPSKRMSNCISSEDPPTARQTDFGIIDQEISAGTKLGWNNSIRQMPCLIFRITNLGDLVASYLYEDLTTLGKSTKLLERIEHHERVVNLKNVMIGKPSRRGDGTFGELVPAAAAVTEKGMVVARGPVATIEIGAETKILAKAMIKQIDRVINDLTNQVRQFKRGGGNPICVAFVGINFGEQYVSFEARKRQTSDSRSCAGRATPQRESTPSIR